MRDAFGEDLLRYPGAIGPPFREIDHRFLGSAQVEGRTAAIHRVPDGLHVGIGVGVQQLQEEAEVLRVALVRSGRQQQKMVGRIA